MFGESCGRRVESRENDVAWGTLRRAARHQPRLPQRRRPHETVIGARRHPAEAWLGRIESFRSSISGQSPSRSQARLIVIRLERSTHRGAPIPRDTRSERNQSRESTKFLNVRRCAPDDNVIRVGDHRSRRPAGEATPHSATAPAAPPSPPCVKPRDEIGPNTWSILSPSPALPALVTRLFRSKAYLDGGAHGRRAALPRMAQERAKDALLRDEGGAAEAESAGVGRCTRGARDGSELLPRAAVAPVDHAPPALSPPLPLETRWRRLHRGLSPALVAGFARVALAEPQQDLERGGVGKRTGSHAEVLGQAAAVELVQRSLPRPSFWCSTQGWVSTTKASAPDPTRAVGEERR